MGLLYTAVEVMYDGIEPMDASGHLAMSVVSVDHAKTYFVTNRLRRWILRTVAGEHHSMVAAVSVTASTVQD